MQRYEGLLNQNNSLWFWLWLPSSQKSPAKDKEYKGQWDTTQSNVARIEKGTVCKAAHGNCSFDCGSALYSRARHSLQQEKTHLQWAALAAETLVSPLF